eukprot:jgi/Chrzof1/6686/Cz19g05210.t1
MSLRTSHCQRIKQPPDVKQAATAQTLAAQQQSTGFDLSLAVALAAAAFEAYLEPSGAEGFEEVSTNGTKVTYTDRQFLLATFDGVLHLTIKSATDLKSVNLTGGSDPYVIASINDSAATTAVAWNNTTPIWNQSFYLYVRSADEDALRLRVLDKNRLLSDVDLGTVNIPVKQFETDDGQQKDMTLTLKGRNQVGIQGKVCTRPIGRGTRDKKRSFVVGLCIVD